MKLFLCILGAAVLSSLLFFGIFGIYIVSAVVIGVLFRALMLLQEIHKQTVPANDKVNDAYKSYMNEREN